MIYAIDINFSSEVGRITGFTSPLHPLLSDEKSLCHPDMGSAHLYRQIPKTYQITGYVGNGYGFPETGSTEQMVHTTKYVFTNRWY